MKDRFKFKIYDYTCNRMVYFDDLCNIDYPYTLKADYQYQEIHYHKTSDFMQCTGLKDRHGKLIYEGDIVIKKVFIDYQGDGQFQPDVYIDREYIGVVHFSASNGATLQKVKIFETESPHEPKKQREKRECPKATKLIACRSEVIGNIYQDPGYLEKIPKIIETELKE